MELGSNIFNLRKRRNVTQEELAAELGVTATAVSKWEKGYTLPDVLMLCAIADYFDVTTDELLGRVANRKQAIIVAQEETLGSKIAALAKRYGIHCQASFTDYQSALEYEAIHKDSLQYMFIALNSSQEVPESSEGNGVIHIHVQKVEGSDEDVLNGIELYLKNEEAFKNIADTSASLKK